MNGRSKLGFALLAALTLAGAGCDRGGKAAPAVKPGEAARADDAPATPAVTAARTVAQPRPAQPVAAALAAATNRPARVERVSEPVTVTAPKPAYTPETQALIEAWKQTNQVLMAEFQKAGEARRQYYEYETRLRQEDPECARLTTEIEQLQQQIMERQTAIEARLEANPERVRMRRDLEKLQSETDGLRLAAQARMRAETLSNPELRAAARQMVYDSRQRNSFQSREVDAAAAELEGAP